MCALSLFKVLYPPENTACSPSPPPSAESCSLATAQTVVFKIAVVGPRSQEAQSVLHTLRPLLILSPYVQVGVSSDLSRSGFTTKLYEVKAFSLPVARYVLSTVNVAIRPSWLDF
jgi:hypothetical protein